MDLTINATAVCPIPLKRPTVTQMAFDLPDVGAGGASYKIVNGDGSVTNGTGTVSVGAPNAGGTRILCVPADNAGLAPHTIILLNGGGSVISTLTTDLTGLTAGTPNAYINVPGFTGTASTTQPVSDIAVVTIPNVDLAALGPWSAFVFDGGGNHLGDVNGRVIPVDPPSAAANATALLDLVNGVETGITPRQALRLMASILGGVSVLGPGSATFKAAGTPGTTRVVVTLPGDGSRPALTLTL